MVMGNVSMDWQSYKMEGLVANGLDYETLRLVRILGNLETN